VLQDHSRITIKEIARMCGVSTQTVSRVINKRPDVSPETRKAVEAAIAATGFQPSAVARSLVQRRSQTLGVIVAGLRYFGVAQTLNGITEEAQASGYGILLKEIESTDTVDIAPVIEFMIAHRVEGLIFAAPQLGTNIATARAQMPASSPPIVFLKSEPSSAFSTIVIDNYGGARMATTHLLALGRRRIGHLAGPLPWREAQDRHDGWLDAIRDAGLEPGPVVSGTWSSASGEVAFEQLLARDPDLDGIFVANDQMALGVLHVAQARGIAIPDDIAVVGFDGLDEAAHFSPTLTTVVQPLRELGELAVREVLAIAKEARGRETVRSLTLATQLVVRESAPAAPRVQSAPVRAGRGSPTVEAAESR
jgi:LacI family transcriptional regulator